MTQDVLAEALRATYDDGDGLGYRLVLMDESGGVIPTPLPDTFIEAIRAALVRTPETLDVDELIASLPAVRRRTDAQPMIPESAVRRLLTTLAATPSPAPPEGLRTALKTFHWLAHPHGCDETKCKGVLALAASPAPDPGADVERDAAGEPVRFWWCPGWQTLNATRYHGAASPDVKGCGEVSYYRAAPSAEPPETETA